VFPDLPLPLPTAMLDEAVQFRDELAETLRERRRSIVKIELMCVVLTAANLAVASWWAMRLASEATPPWLGWPGLGVSAWACSSIVDQGRKAWHVWRFERAHLAAMITELQRAISNATRPIAEGNA
jgi:hypothetical protein